MWIIYQAKNKINNKVYIGMTKQPLNLRIKCHKSYAKHKRDNSPFHIALGKYEFEWSIIERGITNKLQAEKREDYYINKFRNICYNIITSTQGLRGPLNGRFGKKRTEPPGNAIKVLWVEGNRVFNSKRECAEKLEMDYSTIRRYCKGTVYRRGYTLKEVIQ